MRNGTDTHTSDRLIGELFLQQMAIEAVDQGAVEDVPASPFCLALVHDVFDVLEQYGYDHGDAEHVGRAVALLQAAAETFAGGGQ